MKLQQYKDTIIDMYCNQDLNTVQIANILGCSDSGVQRLLKRYNIPRIHTPNELKFSQDQTNEICQRYTAGETTIELAKIYKVCDSSIAKILRINNIDIRSAQRRSVIKNHDYFEEIDSIDKAYFLGWLISDGCVIDHKTRSGRSKTISLEIHSDDKYILELFADVLGASRDIVKKSGNRDTVYIRFASDKMAKDLEKYGVKPRKSHTTHLPNISKELMPHLIRGIFDGDGTITIGRRDKQAHIAFYGSLDICTQIADYLHSTLGLNKNKVSKTTCYHVWYGGNNLAKDIQNFIYQNCGCYFLKRKFLLFKSIV